MSLLTARHGLLCTLESAPPSPFNVVSDADFNQNYQIRYSNLPGYNRNYAYKNSNPASMLYRKVHVNSTVRIIKYQINTNGSVTSNQALEFYSNELNWWPAPAYIYDSSLNFIQINTVQPGDTTTYVGKVDEVYTELGDGRKYAWNYTSCYCDVTLQSGDYWWPLFPYMHISGIQQTNFGYHSTLNGELMALRAYNDVSNSSYPPLYITAQGRLPYLHLFDYAGNEYSV